MAGSRLENVAKGVLAILIWIVLYALLQWYQAIGWLGYLILVAPLAAILWIASRVSKRARDFLTDKIPDTLE
jgi:ABC-type uncharacterized transport system permease subunit